MKLKTAFAELNNATNGGLDTGGIWAIAGCANTFKTGLGYTLAKDIIMMNPAEEPSRVLVLRTEESNDRVFNTFNRLVTGLENPNISFWTYPDFIKKFEKNNWFLQTHTSSFINMRNIDDVVYHIDQANQGRFKVKVIVFDYLVGMMMGNTVMPTPFFAELDKLCKERDILAIAPAHMQRHGMYSAENIHDFAKRTGDVASIMAVEPIGEPGNPHKELTMEVLMRGGDATSKLSIPFRQYPQYGLQSALLPLQGDWVEIKETTWLSSEEG